MGVLRYVLFRRQKGGVINPIYIRRAHFRALRWLNILGVLIDIPFLPFSRNLAMADVRSFLYRANLPEASITPVSERVGLISKSGLSFPSFINRRINDISTSRSEIKSAPRFRNIKCLSVLIIASSFLGRF